MRITVFTSNQPRHVALIERLARVSTEVIAVQECNTLLPGKVKDFFGKSQVMQDYFSRVISAERVVFGPPRVSPSNVRTMSMKMGDLSLLELHDLREAMSADAYVVFGASYIKGPLIDELVCRRAMNVHMGVSPWYRGSSTNFWAMYDKRPEFVGATIHLLSRGLDSGDMLCHAFPNPASVDPFEFGMLAVKAAHESLERLLLAGSWKSISTVPQDRSHQIRYTRNADFTDEVASEYLSRVPTPDQLHQTLKQVDRSRFQNIAAIV